MSRRTDIARQTAFFMVALGSVMPASGQELRDFCGDRPGLATPACTVDKGHVQVEVGLADWTLDKQPGTRTDTVVAGDTSVRIGVTDSTEFRLGWTAYGHVRMRDRTAGAISRAGGIGDVTVGLKQNLSHPSGDGLSIALLPFATLPSGHQEVGTGDWGAGLLLPVNYQLNDVVTLELTPEVDAAVDDDGSGRHLTYSSVFGLQAKVSEKIQASLELQAIRDRDPDEHSTMLIGGISAAYAARKQLQLDAGANIGLNSHTPDAELYLGVAAKF